MRANDSQGMKLVQTTLNESARAWMEKAAAAEGDSVAGFVRRLLMLAYAKAGSPKPRKARPAKKARKAVRAKRTAKKSRKASKKRTAKKARTRQLALPGVERKTAKASKPRRRTKTEKRGLNHIEPEAP